VLRILTQNDPGDTAGSIKDITNRDITAAMVVRQDVVSKKLHVDAPLTCVVL
jgi:hypothetical protein